MERSIPSALCAEKMEKKIKSEILLLRECKSAKILLLESALTDTIANAAFKEPFKKKCHRYIVKLLHLPVIGFFLRLVKKAIYDLWKKR